MMVISDTMGVDLLDQFPFCIYDSLSFLVWFQPWARLWDHSFSSEKVT